MWGTRKDVEFKRNMMWGNEEIKQEMEIIKDVDILIDSESIGCERGV